MSTHLVCDSRLACDDAESTSQHMHAVTREQLSVSSPATAGTERQSLMKHYGNPQLGSTGARDVQNPQNAKTTGSMSENQMRLNALQGDIVLDWNGSKVQIKEGSSITPTKNEDARRFYCQSDKTGFWRPRVKMKSLLGFIWPVSILHKRYPHTASALLSVVSSVVASVQAKDIIEADEATHSECSEVTQCVINVNTPLGMAKYTVPAGIRDVKTSPQGQRWVETDRKALQVVLAAGNCLVSTSELYAKGQEIAHCVTARRLKLDQVTSAFALICLLIFTSSIVIASCMLPHQTRSPHLSNGSFPLSDLVPKDICMQSMYPGILTSGIRFACKAHSCTCIATQR